MILPKKVSKWKIIFFFYKTSVGLEMPLFWRVEKVVEGIGLISSESFEALNVLDII